MRRVNIITGLTQRIGEFLGNWDKDSTPDALNAWSIQAAMISNLRRLNLALLNGSTVGKILSGLNTSYSSSSITISSGYGVTVNGDIITLSAPKVISVGEMSEGNNFICLKYSLVEDETANGKSTSIINESGLYPMVFDEAGSVGNYDNIVAIESSIGAVTANHNYVYIATANVSGGSIISLTTTSLSTFGQVIVKNDGDISFTSGVSKIVIFPDVLKDTAQEYNVSNGVYTAASSAYRQVSWMIAAKTNTYWSSADKYLKTYLSINDSDDDSSNYCFRGTYNRIPYIAPAHTEIINAVSQGNALIYLSGGNTLSLKVLTDVTNIYIPPLAPPGYTENEKNMCYLTISTIKDQ